MFVKRIDPMPVLSLTYYSSEWMTCESLGIAIMDIEWQKKILRIGLTFLPQTPIAPSLYI